MSTTYDVVAALAQAISQRIGESRYNLWFAEKTRILWQDDQLTIGVPNLFIQDWLQQKFGADIRACTDEIVRAGVELRFVIDPQLFQASRQHEAQQHNQAAAATDTGPIVHAGHSEPRRPVRQRRWRLLQDFVVGACNRVAHASVASLVESPEDCPIPLVLHGGVGLGKTHLLEGVRAGLARCFPEWKVLFLSAEDFTNRFVQAMHQQKLSAFRKTFRTCDALLVDDAGFLAKKMATQEEFLHTLDALQSEHRLVMLTTDCHPRLADHFLPELTDRLVGGAVWGLSSPDAATRRDLLRAKSSKIVPLPEEVLAFLAENLRGNVRQLEGAVHSVVHLAKVTQRPINIELATDALGDLLRHSIRFATLEDIDKAICEVLGISRQLLFSKKRNWIYSYPRMLAMYLARLHTCATFSEIGKHFGGRNHTTALAADKKVREWLKGNITLQLGKRTMPVRDIIERIESVLQK